MNKDDIVTFKAKSYLILDIASYNENKYLYTVALDEEELPTKEYKYFKASEEHNAIYLEEVTDPKILELIITLFTSNYLNESLEQAA